MNKWRRFGWPGNPNHCPRCDQHPDSCYICVAGYEAGADAMLDGVLKWLNEPDSDHTGIAGYYLHRKDCPICWESLKESGLIKNTS